MKILITGGVGFIGSHIANLYLKNNHTIIILDDFSSGKKRNIDSRKVKIIRADLLDRKKVSEVISLEKPDLVNHQAAHVSVRKSGLDPFQDTEQNIFGLLNLLDAIKVSTVKKIIFASSGGAIYGNQKLPLNENMCPEPLSPYGINKLACENFLNFYKNTYGIPFISLRYSNVYGIKQNHSNNVGIIGIIIRNILNKIPIIIHGDGSQTRDFIHVDDVARANLLSIQSDFCGVLNIGSGIETSLTSLIKQIENKLQRKAKIEYKSELPYEQKRCVLEIKRANEVLKWNPQLSIEGSLDQIIDWYLKKNT